MAAGLPLAPVWGAPLLPAAASPGKGGKPRPGISGGRARSDCGTTGTGTLVLPPAAATGGSMGCTAVADLAGVAASGGSANDVAAAGLLGGVAAGLAAALAAAASALAASAAALASAFATALASALVSGFSAGVGRTGTGLAAVWAAGATSEFAASRWGAVGIGRMVAAGSLAELLAEPMTGTPPDLLAELLPEPLTALPDALPAVLPDVVLVEATAMEGLPLACVAAEAVACGAACAFG